MRYRETGELHLTFHDSVRFVLDYLEEHYGEEGMAAVIRANALEVHRSIRKHLEEGDVSELVSHWIYYLTREKAPYRISAAPDRLTIEVLECPAFRTLREKGRPTSRNLCLCTRLTNEFWCEGTPFEASLELLGEGHCRQTIVRKGQA